jgi:hypothetical protein
MVDLPTSMMGFPLVNPSYGPLSLAKADGRFIEVAAPARVGRISRAPSADEPFDVDIAG